jgi:hypothetical protein
MMVKSLLAFAAGAFAAALLVMGMLYSIGALEMSSRPLILRPIIDHRPTAVTTSTSTPTPEPTATPEPTPVPRFEPIVPPGRKPGTIQTITTGKRKRLKEAPTIDGAVTADLTLVQVGDRLYAAMEHVCCDCASTHSVRFVVYRTAGLDLPMLRTMWRKDEGATRQNRARQFGAGWDRPTLDRPTLDWPRDQ